MKLIDKDALVAEITHKIKVLEAFIKNFDGISDKVEKAKNKIEALGDVLLSIENIEVKDMDLEKEIDNIWNPRFNLGWDEKSLLSINHEGFTTIAKHFFELGVKAQKGERYENNND